MNQHARLRLKSVFHLGAMSAIRMKPGRRCGRTTGLLPTQTGRGQK
ncbi:hypothetical protein [Spirosoma validum]|nr:hypothetical protein [Spirosoma validum]